MVYEDDGPNEDPWHYFSTYNGESVRPALALRLPEVYFCFYVREDEDEGKRRLDVFVLRPSALRNRSPIEPESTPPHKACRRTRAWMQ